jgi:acetoacetate decarboxylase
MPDPGRAPHEKYRVTLPTPRPDFAPLPWNCDDVTMLNVYFEVRKDVLLDRLPPEYNRSSPAYCRLVITDHRSSPIGRFRDAFLGLGCRLTMAPAAFVAVSITDNKDALAAGLFERGFPSTLGKIDFEVMVESAHALISDAQGPLLELTMPTLQTIEPSRLAYDHVDAIATREDGSTQLVIAKPDVKIVSAAICKNARIEYPVERDSPWQALDCRNLVSAQVVRGSRVFAGGDKPG